MDTPLRAALAALLALLFETPQIMTEVMLRPYLGPAAWSPVLTVLKVTLGAGVTFALLYWVMLPRIARVATTRRVLVSDVGWALLVGGACGAYFLLTTALPAALRTS